MGKVAVLRTSDRNAFRSCRRKWAWSSHLRGNLGPIQNATPLWFGTGFHFVMEDYHGHRKFQDPHMALDEYVRATKLYNPRMIPDDYQDAADIGHTMIDYLIKWEKRREFSLLPTYVVDGEPQVEINARIPVPMDPALIEKYGLDEVVYSLTIDRVVEDPVSGMLWLFDYKTAKQFGTSMFQTDSQITTYCWAATKIYDRPIAGMIYAQHLKHPIGLPKPLKSGALSCAQNQRTTSILYQEQLENIYKTVAGASEKERDYLNYLMMQEDERQDKFIRYDYIHRSQHMMEAEGMKILMEAEDMLNPNLALYPNPSRECTTFCSFNGPCVSMDDGSDWEATIQDGYQQRPAEYDGWREYIRWPGEEPETETETSIDWNNI